MGKLEHRLERELAEAKRREQSLDNLLDGREMQKAVATIVCRAAINAGCVGLPPFGASGEMIEKAAHSRSLSMATNGISAGGMG